MSSAPRDECYRTHVETLEEVARRCLVALSGHSRVSAVFLVGSLARGEADESSDVDLCIVVDGGASETVAVQSEELIAGIGPRLTGHLSPQPFSYSALLDIGSRVVKIDLDFHDLDDLEALAARSAEGRTYLHSRRCLLDRCSAAETIAAVEAAVGKTGAPDLRAAAFLVSAWSVIRMADRGERLEAADILATLRDPPLTSLLCRLCDAPFENYRRLERKLPGFLLMALQRTFPRDDGPGILVALRESLSLFIVAADLLGEVVAAPERATFARLHAAIDVRLGKVESVGMRTLGGWELEKP